MDKAHLDTQTDILLPEVLGLSHSHVNRVADAATALSQQVNEIGMTGFSGGVQRSALVAGKGMMELPTGVVEAVKKEGVTGLLTTSAESAAAGFVLSKVLPRVAPLAVASAALGTYFAAKTGGQFYDAFAKGLSANNQAQMDQAASSFGRAAGSLVVNAAVGLPGYKLGSALARPKLAESVGAVITAPSAPAAPTHGTELRAAMHVGPNDGLIKLSPTDAGMEAELRAARHFEETNKSAFAEDRPGNYPRRINRETDTVVVGAGFAGLSIADRLASSGIQTVVVDAGIIGGKTSQFAGGMVTRAGDPSFIELRDTHGEEVLRQYVEGMSQAHQQVMTRAGKLAVDFVPGSSQQISYGGATDEMKAEFDLLHKYDANTAFVTGKEAEAIFAHAQAAMRFLGEGSVNPFRYSSQMAKAGNFAVFENSPVVGLRVGSANNPVQLLTADGGVIKAKRVVFATGTADKMSEHLNSCVEAVQCFASVAKVDKAVHIEGNIFDTDGAVRTTDGKIANTDSDAPYNYFRRVDMPGHEGSGEHILFGGADRVLPDQTAVRETPDLQSQLQTLFPDGQILHKWTGTIEESHDGMSIIDKHPSLPIFRIRGIGGSGLDTSQFTANEVLKVIQGQPSILSSDRFKDLGHQS